MAIAAHPTLFKIAGTTVAELTSITDTLTADELDTTSHDTSNKWRTFIAGLKGMEISIEGNYIPTNDTHDMTATGLLGLFVSGNIAAMTITWPDSTVFSFNGLVRDISHSAPVDGILAFTATVRITGAPTLA